MVKEPVKVSKKAKNKASKNGKYVMKRRRKVTTQEKPSTPKLYKTCCSSILPVIIREPQNSLELQEHFNIRFKLLREPLGNPPGSEKYHEIVYELTATHLSAYLKPSGDLVGACMGFLRGDSAEIHALCVVPEHQKHGIGKLLMLALEEELKHKGATKFRLHSRLDVQKFYEKLGYNEVARIPKEEAKELLGLDLDFVDMEKLVQG
eukprot:TRINITY_DN125_c0_g1_i1.p2 TRINITY_DN125_c0_g1~~TRINITY_DN125_c0_g1_i1.p2  ORF type:complete len:206 (-),score=22.46 TRINITY_DN125_c0_g1_i1:114-731(-)